MSYDICYLIIGSGPDPFTTTFWQSIETNLEGLQQTHLANGANSHPLERFQLEKQQVKEKTQCTILPRVLCDQKL